jgi:hypothetical protein
MSQTSTLLEMSSNGIAKLANKSAFRIPAGHIPRTKDWAPGTEIIVERSNNPAWQFVLKSAATPEQWVHATPSSGTWDW